MKHKIENIICVLLVLSVAGIVAYNLYSKRVSEWKEVAREELKEMLHERAVTSGIGPVSYSGDAQFGEEHPRTATVQTERGIEHHSYSAYRDEHNVEQSPFLRMVYSVLYREGRLTVDSLGKSWNERLAGKSFPGEGYLQMVVTGVEAPDSVVVSRYGAPDAWARADSLVFFTLGYACEIGITGFASFGFGRVYSVTDWMWIVFIVLLGGAVCLLWFKRETVCRKLRKKFSLVEKIPVGIVRDPHIHHYDLEDGTFFDREQRILQKGKQTAVLTEQNALLLETFIQAEDYSLSMDELFKKLWPDGSGNEGRLRKAIGRLRKELQKVSSYTIENELGIYRLKLSVYPVTVAENA